MKVVVLFAGALVVGTAGCGVDEQPKRYQESMGTPKNTSTLYPTRSVPSTGFDRTRIPERFRLMQSGPYWVQLVDPEEPFSSIVVGIEPSRSGRDLEAAV
jgi:hypothetical protein